MKKKKKRTPRSLVISHLGGIKRALLEGEKRPAFLEFLKSETKDRRGIYALYDERSKLYYAGKASDLPKRLDNHLKDKHAESWDEMTLFFLSKTANVSELEGLIVAAARPKGNKQKPKIGNDLRKSLRAFLKNDALSQIDQAIFPREKISSQDKLSSRITPKKLKSVPQSSIAKALGISQGRVSQLVNDDKDHLRSLREYIVESGKRDAILLLLQKSKLD